MWFYGSQRWWGTKQYFAQLETRYWNKTQGTPFYTPDFDRDETSSDYTNRDTGLRLTWQASSKQKVTFYQSEQHNCLCTLGGSFVAPEAQGLYEFWPNRLSLGTWTYTATNRLLLQAGAAFLPNYIAARRQPGVTRDTIPITELSTGFLYGATAGGLVSTGFAVDEPQNMSQHNERFVLSYVTGSHAVKGGVTTTFGGQQWLTEVNSQGVYYRFNRGVPVQLVQWATPNASKQSNRNIGLFAQDQWTLRGVTLNLGVRFDQITGWVPAQDRPAGIFTPALHIDRVDNVPNFTDLSARLGVAYDIFGNGRTAIKGSIGRYVSNVGVDYTANNNPANAVVLSATRTWTDLNGNFSPDCDLKSFERNGECGPLDNRNFGSVAVNTRYASDVLEGFGNRPYNWQGSLSIQHELRPGMAVSVGYYRTWFGNFFVTDNLAVTPADFDPYCLTAPADARLPGGGGYQICDLGDVKPSKFGLVDNLVTQSSHYGTQKEIYNGVDVTFNGRFGRGGLLQGGFNVGRTAYQCVVVDAPVQFCNNTPPFTKELKVAGAYPLPFWDLQTSATLQNLPAIPLGTISAGGTVAPATWVATNAQIRPVLGRDLAAGTNSVATVNLFPINSEFEDRRLTQLDWRITKRIRLKQARIQAHFDIYNVFNANNIIGEVIRFGPTYRNANQVLGPRLFKLGAQLDF